MTNKLIIIRGLPGTGKSTLAKKLVAQSDTFGGTLRHIEADQYFVNDTGQYVFDKLQLQKAHSYCFSATSARLRNGGDVVVSNTFTRLKELSPYFLLAMELKADIEVIELTKEYGSTHNVPEETIRKMRARWEPIPQSLTDDGTVKIRSEVI